MPISKSTYNTNMKKIYLNISLLYLIVSLSYLFFNVLIGAGVFFISLLLIINIYHKLRISMNSTESYLFLLCFTIPISFRNIFGGDYSVVPIPWFYLILLCLMLDVFISRENRGIKLNSISVVALYILIYSIIPLLISASKIEGIKEFLAYSTFLLGIIIAFISTKNICKENYKKIIDSYIFGILFTSLGIVVQYIGYTYFDLELFRIIFLGGNRLYLSFLFFDMSGITVYMATGIIFLFLLNKEKKYVYSLIIILGMALSSARAGLIVLIISLILFSLFSRNIRLKIGIITVLLLTTSVGIYMLMATRANIDSLSGLFLDNNGRLEPFIQTITLLKSSPFIGFGFDYGQQLKMRGEVVPHFALVNMFGQFGYVISFLYVLVISRIIKLAVKKKMTALIWGIVLSLIGSCVVPGFFDLRFFTVLIMLAILYDVEKRGTYAEKNKSVTFYSRI